ncbi:RNase H domain-containing protein [Trichonephila clavipes]|nr:RNase H domain-containing protein [Trichonephila clavipes]
MNGVHLALRHEGQKVNRIVMTSEKNGELSSLLKSKVAIDERPNYVLSSLDSKSIWILSDSRSAIQHLSNWSSIGDKTGTSIINNLKQVSSSCDVHFQRIPSHVDIWCNEEADALAKAVAREALAAANSLTYLELYSARKHIDKKTWLVPPVHTWYRADSPGGSLAMNCNRCTQTADSRFLRGHLKSLAFQGGQKKTHPICPKCSIE